MKKAKIKWGEDQNPLRWYKKARHSESWVPDVERWMFNQLYDYVEWLHGKVYGGDGECIANNVLRKGNVVRNDGLFVLISAVKTHNIFSGVVLYDCHYRRCIGEFRDDFISDHYVEWKLSSLEEVISAE